MGTGDGTGDVEKMTMYTNNKNFNLKLSFFLLLEVIVFDRPSLSGVVAIRIHKTLDFFPVHLLE
jgi:hypothetical protein